MKRLLRRMRGSKPVAAQLDVPEDMSPRDRAILERVRPYTMTSALRIEALTGAVRYCLAAEIPGAFAECGVWRGGSVMAMLLTLLEQGVRDRDVYLYDTFEGMTTPTKEDTSAFEEPALKTWQRSGQKGEKAWQGVFNQEIFNEDDVRQALLSTGYPEEHLHFVRGPVEQTIPGTLAPQLALLRLDTDWYESTRHEMAHMYPRLSRGGVLIVDDYGHWQGCRQAVDEYFSDKGIAPVLLQRIDYTGRMAVKP
ncbi:MAG: TylF/MycF/NovP-related O-methyltransferase [Stenotrophobium sp.]